MAKYGLSMLERLDSRQNPKSRSFLSNMNQILYVFSLEYIVENKKGIREHLTTRAIANTEEEAQVLLVDYVHRSSDSLITILDIAMLGKDRTWLSAGKKSNNLGARITDEVYYRDL